MGWIKRVGALRRRNKLSAEHDEELRYHLAMIEQSKAETGLSAYEAQLAAKRRFGNLTLLKEGMHEADVLTFLESFARDIRFALRMLAKHPAFTAIAVLALAVGIGVNTAVFTAYKALVLQPLDARDPRQLVDIYRGTPQYRYQTAFSYPDFEFYRDENRVFSGVAATAGYGLALTGGNHAGSPEGSFANTLIRAAGFRFPSVLRGGAEFVSALGVSENYFSVLGVSAIRGRVFLPQDASDLDAHPAVLMSENFWKRRFGRDIGLFHKPIQLNGVSFSVIGITPHDFLGTSLNVPDVWLPMRLLPLVYKKAGLHDREDLCCALYGRLAPGVSLPDAQGQMTLLADRLRRLHAATSEGSKPITITLTPGSHLPPVSVANDPGVVFAVALIMGAVALVLLIACANVASLQLGRAATRQREMGVRLSLGASRSRIIRQLLTESLLLGMLAGGVSMLMAWGALRVLMLEVAAGLPSEWGHLAMHVEPDAHVFVYVFAISLLAGILFGLAPALETSQPDVSSALKNEGNRFVVRLRNARLRDLLVATQVAVCLFLLIGAGLLLRGSIRATTVNPGYETRRVTMLDVYYPPGFEYSHAKQLSEFRQLQTKIHDLPGVQSLTVGKAPDGGGLRTAAVAVDGATPDQTHSARTLYYSYVAPSYFQTLSIPLIEGRGFAEGTGMADPAAVLSNSAAEELWPGKNPIGRLFKLDGGHQFHGAGELVPRGFAYRVIGVAKDTRGILPGDEDSRNAYLLLPPDHLGPLLVRSDRDPQKLMIDLNMQVKSVDENLIVYAQTLDGLLTGTPTFVISRLSALFASIIGVLGLALACVGIYGTVNYAVIRRTREVGIRMALGARQGDVLSLVLLESSRPVFMGLLAGLLGADAIGHVLRALLFGLSPLDPISFLGVASLFLAIALLAAYLPARTAALLDPMVALRCE